MVGARSSVGEPLDLTRRRREYGRGVLNEAEVATDPMVQVRSWLDEAVTAEGGEPTAMSLATVDHDGRPSARTVLLKRVDHGLVFVTNLGSRKSRHLAANPHAALLLQWDELERQIEVEGAAERLDDADADALFAARPRQARLTAWASAQSQPVADRHELEQALAEVTARFEGHDVPRPPQWGGWRIVPAQIELWQGRAGRLHDRLRYRRDAGGTWRVERLAP